MQNNYPPMSQGMLGNQAMPQPRPQPHGMMAQGIQENQYPMPESENEQGPRFTAIQRLYQSLETPTSSFTDTEVEERWARAEAMYDKMLAEGDEENLMKWEGKESWQKFDAREAREREKDEKEWAQSDAEDEELSAREKSIQKIYQMMETPQSDFTDTEVEERWGRAEKMYDELQKPFLMNPLKQMQAPPQEGGMMSPPQSEGVPHGSQVDDAAVDQMMQALLQNPTPEVVQQIVQHLQGEDDPEVAEFVRQLTGMANDPQRLTQLATQVLQSE